jgi:DNA modification methylase
MRPYYQENGITIYHGDCREVLPNLARDSVDMLLTDPPYGALWQSGFRKETLGPIIGDESLDVAEEAIPLACLVLKQRRHAYVFGRYKLTVPGRSDLAELIWNKGQVGLGDTASTWGISHEYIQFFTSNKSRAGAERGDGRLACRLRRGSVLNVPRLNSGQVGSHPTEKPVLLLRQLIESSSCIGETVLDPFMGCGSTAVACIAEARRFIGIEIEEKYCEIAAKRLAQGVLQLEAVSE